MKKLFLLLSLFEKRSSFQSLRILKAEQKFEFDYLSLFVYLNMITYEVYYDDGYLNESPILCKNLKVFFVYFIYIYIYDL